MEYDFNILKKFKINPTKIKKGKIIMKDTRTLLKNVFDKKEKLVRKCKKIKQDGGGKESENKINIIESELTEIQNLHNNLKKLMFLNNGIIEVFRN